jgi:hypothetical protein
VNPKKTFVTVTQLSAICGLSEAWLRDESRAGRIPYLKVGTKTMFSPAAVEQALLARTRAPSASIGNKSESAHV